MKSYKVNAFSDMGRGELLKYLELPDVVYEQGVIYHYHIYNVPFADIGMLPDSEVTYKCHWRVVLPDIPVRSLKDVSTLFVDVLDRYHPNQVEHGDFVSFLTCDATKCTNCGDLDTVYKLLPCRLCSAPLCPTCHAGQGYCNGHLN